MYENLHIYSSILHYRNNLNVIFKKKFASHRVHSNKLSRYICDRRGKISLKRPVWNTVVAARPGTNEHCMTKEDIATNTRSIYTSRVYCEIAYRLTKRERG